MSEGGRAPFAVVTGGSSGIGFVLARELVERGHDVLLAAEDASGLAGAARRLGGDGRRVTTHASDLATEAGVDALVGAIRAAGRPVDVLCVNAGIGLGGPFVETEPSRELRMIDLNVRGAVQLTKPVARAMAARGEGQILITSSIAATMPDPFEAVYGATKTFLRSFGEAIREELRDKGVVVTVLMPGVTDTGFFARADMLDTRAGASSRKDDPATVAKAAIDALEAGRDKSVPTLKNKVMATVAEALPEPLAARADRLMSEPGSSR